MFNEKILCLKSSGFELNCPIKNSGLVTIINLIQLNPCSPITKNLPVEKQSLKQIYPSAVMNYLESIRQLTKYTHIAERLHD